jgi:lysophospholipase L1-like esterase
MRLLTVGDSFTYGEELADLTSAWPNLLANKLGCELTNIARPGSGNTRMVRQCVERVAEYDMVIIPWTHHARIEFADKNGFYDIWPGCRKEAQTVNTPWRGEIVDYIARYHNDEYTLRQQLMYIILMQSFLTHNNKKYLMLESFQDLEARSQRKKDSLFLPVDPTYFLGWPNDTMMEWTYGCSKGPGGHFLEQGHEIVANKIYEHIRHFGWIS